MRLLVTRPQPDADRTAEALRARGHEAVVSPLTGVEIIGGVRLPEGVFQAVLATSSNGVRALAARPESVRLRALPLLAVGDRTAGEARRLGFADVRSAGGAVDDLFALVRAACDPAAGALLYAAGEARAGDLDGRLARAGLDVRTVVLYRTAGEPLLSEEAAAALRQNRLDGVLLYSPRGSMAFVAALAATGLVPLGADVRLFCLSRAVAEPLKGAARGPVAVAAAPTEAQLLAALDAASEPRCAAAG
jgi:uroporphyrinogen-III synthase